MDREQFAQISETRAILEMAALRLAAERNRDELVRRWARHVAAMKTAMEAGEGRRYSRTDGEFHKVLFDLAANPFLDDAGQSFSAKMAAVRNRLGAQPEHMARSLPSMSSWVSSNGTTSPLPALLERHIRFARVVLGRAGELPKSRWRGFRTSQ
jgi:DNA-binding GntR family transcriptional regulator